MSTHPLHCADRSGFLFAHACDRPPAGACSRCNKPICAEHTRQTPSGPACVACLRSGDRDSSRDTSSSSSTSTSGGTTAAATAAGVVAAGTFGGAGASGAWTGEGDTRDDPYFYGSETERAAYYDADDFRAFDVTAAAAATEASGADAPETDTGAS